MPQFLCWFGAPRRGDAWALNPRLSSRRLFGRAVSGGNQLLFRFTKIWEKIIVIIREKWTERILINRERVEPRFA